LEIPQKARTSNSFAVLIAAIIISLLIGGMLGYAIKRARREYIAGPNN